jgi:hypothetical protein
MRLQGRQGFFEIPFDESKRVPDETVSLTLGKLLFNLGMGISTALPAAGARRARGFAACLDTDR